MQNKMTEGNVIRALAAFTVPLILSGLFQQLFNWVDAFKPVFGNMVVAYAEAFSWIFLLAVLLLRYVVKTR